MSIPARTPDTMSDAISLTSPNGRMSDRTKATLQENLRVALFGKDGLHAPGLPPQPKKQESLRRQAKTLRDLASRGMRPRAGLRDAAALEAQADALDAQA